MTDNSFWQRVQQQTTTTVGLGYVTTDPLDPSLSYWPGPGLLPPFKIGREWISHYTSFQYSENFSDSEANSNTLELSELGNVLSDSAADQSKHTVKFATDILITYKLKNPAQFLRDFIQLEYLQEFASRFERNIPMYLMTGYKVSRNVQTALEQQDSQADSVKFQLSTTAKVVPSPIGGLAVPSGSLGDTQEHKALTTIDYQAPGDSIFFVRYQKIMLDHYHPGTIILPAPSLPWYHWLIICGKRPLQTVIIRKGDSRQQILVTHRGVASATRVLSASPQLPLTGRHSTMTSCDNMDLIKPGHGNATCPVTDDSRASHYEPRATEGTPLLRK